MNTTSTGHRTSKGMRRGIRLVACAVAITTAAAFASAAPASAGTAVARSYGMQCYPSGASLRQNYPNISTDSVANQVVYFRVTLQWYTTSGWRSIRTSRWYYGVSNYTGRKALGYSGGQPYYFAYSTSSGSYVGPERGPVFTSLQPAYYRTIETYVANGSQWSRYSFVSDNPSAQYCYA